MTDLYVDIVKNDDRVVITYEVDGKSVYDCVKLMPLNSLCCGVFFTGGCAFPEMAKEDAQELLSYYIGNENAQKAIAMI